MKSTTEDLGQALIRHCSVNLFDESLPRILKCLSLLSDDEIWHRPNDEVVSVGNLILHLCGNVRQYIMFGIDGQIDLRKREDEFSETGPIPRKELLQRLETTMAEAKKILNALDHSTLLDKRNIQGETHDLVRILVHVTEHFSYHTGQITYFTKSTKAVDTGYYAGRNLNETG